MADEPNAEGGGPGGGHGVAGAVARAVTAAAAAGAASYGVRRVVERRQHDQNGGVEDESRRGGGEQEKSGRGAGLLAKKDDLAETLSAKAAGVKEKAKELRPGQNKSPVSWESASEHLLPVAREAAAALGKKAAEKAPEVVRTELIPKFIEGFTKAS